MSIPCYRCDMKTSFDQVIRKRLIIEAVVFPDNAKELCNKTFLENYLKELTNHAHMTIVFGPLVHNWAERLDYEKYAGLEGVVIWAESGVQLYTWEKHNALTIDIYSCKDFSVDKMVKFTKLYFSTEQIEWREVEPILTLGLPENEHVEVRDTPSKGKGLFLKHDVRRNTVLASFDADIYYAKRASELTLPVRDRGIQCGEYFYRDSHLVQFINHSCEPNAGIHGLFDIVAMSDLKMGTEITFDYAMSEDSDWELPEGECRCGNLTCRGRVGPYRNLTLSKKIEYWDYTSDWLKTKYGFPK